MLISSIKDEFIPSQELFLECSPSELYKKLFNDYKLKVKSQIEKLFKEAFEKNSKVLFVKSLILFADCVKNLGFNSLYLHFEQVINSIKNVSADICFILPSIYKQVLANFEQEAEKIAENINFDKQFGKLAKDKPNVNIYKPNEEVKVSSQMNIYDHRKVEDSIYSKIIPVAFKGLIRNSCIDKNQNNIEKLFTKKEDNRECTAKRKRNNIDSISDSYPFKQEKLNCVIF